MGYGILYAVFVEHQTLDGLGSALATGFMRAAENRMTESRAALSDAASRSFVYVRQVDAHGHWIGLGLLLLSGSVIFPLGVLLETWNRGTGPQAIAVIGSALVILGLSGTAWGFARSNS